MNEVKPPINPIIEESKFTDVGVERREQKRVQDEFFGSSDVEVNL